MPHIDIQGPRMTRAKKAQVVAGVTKAYCEATGMEPAHLIIHISEHPYDNVGVGGGSYRMPSPSCKRGLGTTRWTIPEARALG